VASHPALFTLEFRKKMARLSSQQRLEWLNSLANELGGFDSPDVVRAQELREVARGCRLGLVESVAQHLGPFDDRYLAGLLEVPRERFVRRGDVPRSADDTPLPLDAAGLATISAPHAYLLSFRLVELAPGDSLVELGTGSGYGAALAAFVVGAEGRVLTFEIDPELAAWATDTLAPYPNVTVGLGDAVTNAQRWEGASKVVVTFAIDRWPDAWLDALPEGGTIVAPVGGAEQRLVRTVRRRGRIIHTEHGAVRYVRNRSAR
jgi:protein-L-isoaspartate(D-aspartate) O-methyltransferase